MTKACRTCGHYSKRHQKCLEGKIDPPTIKGGCDAARFMGISYICGKSKYKEKIIRVLLQELQVKE